MVKTTDAEIDLGQLMMKLDNSRHEKKPDAAAAMKELVDNERVVELALDIAEMGGLNPLDRIGVVRDRGSPKDDPSYVAAEGNRRVAALMLLDDPDRMPPDVGGRAARVRRLRVAGKGLIPIGPVRVVIFPSFEAADPWIDRMHVASGADGARKRWNATQQARRNGETSNVEAVELIAAARKARIISSGEAETIAPTNVTRIVSSSARRMQIGLVGSGSVIRRTLPWDAFRIGLGKLMRDQLDRPAEHNSRALNNAEKLNAYVATIVRAMGAPASLPDGENRPLAPTKAEREAHVPTDDDDDAVSNEIEDDDVGDASDRDADDGSDGDSPEKDEEPTRGKGDNAAPKGGVVAKVDALAHAIAALDDPSIIELYASITTVSARQHPVLLCIACSTLLELLFKASGWDEKGRIVDQIMNKAEVRAKFNERALGSIGDLLRGMRARANLSKHHNKVGKIDGNGLIGDMATLADVYVAVADMAVAVKGRGG